MNAYVPYVEANNDVFKSDVYCIKVNIRRMISKFTSFTFSDFTSLTTRSAIRRCYVIAAELLKAHCLVLYLTIHICMKKKTV